MKPASHRSLTLVLQSVQVHLKDFMFQEAGVCRTCSSVPWVVPFPEGLALPSGGSLYLRTVSAHRTDNTEIVLHISSRMKKAEAIRTQNNYVYHL